MNEDSTPERAVGVDWGVLGHLAVPDLDAVAGDRPWPVPAEGGQDVAVDHVTVAIGSAGPAREPDRDAPLFDQVSNPLAARGRDGFAVRP